MKFFSKTWNRTQSIFKQGFSHRELAMLITVSFVLTTFPIYGITTIVATYVAVKFKMNIPALIFFVYLLEPIRFILFIPFSKLGIFVTSSPVQSISIDAIKDSFTSGIPGIVSFFSHQFLFAFIGWLLIVVPISIPLFYILKLLFSSIHIDFKRIFKLNGITGENEYKVKKI